MSTKYVVTTRLSLREACIKNKWFTCGDCEQYDKMFKANVKSNGFTLEQIASIIWVCSDCVDYSSIKSKLEELQEKYFDIIGLQKTIKFCI